MSTATLIFFTVGFALVLGLYAAKALLLRAVRSRSIRIASFLLVTMACVPLAWLISPDWHNPNVREIANWIGTPLVIITVPTVSFLYDYHRRATAIDYGRAVVEAFIAVPIWALLWFAMEVFVLRWSSLS